MSRNDRSKTTVTQLARKLGLSVTTVSFVLNGRAKEFGIADETVGRVLDAAKGMNYVPNAVARSLRQRSSNMIGIIFPHLRNNWAHRIMSGFSPIVQESGNIPFLVSHGDDSDIERSQVEMLLENRAKGFVVNPLYGSIETYRRIVDQGIPLVFFSDSLAEMPEIPHVVWDPWEVSIAIHHLIETGRTRIGFVGIDDDRIMSKSRYYAYRQVMAGAGLKIENDWIFLLPPGSCLKSVLRERSKGGKMKFDSLFCVFDDYALGAQEEITDMGLKVPDDIALITLGDSIAASPRCYDLSVVSAPVEEEGRAAAELVLEEISGRKGRSPATEIVKGGHLIPRKSTAT